MRYLYKNCKINLFSIKRLEDNTLLKFNKILTDNDEICDVESFFLYLYHYLKLKYFKNNE